MEDRDLYHAILGLLPPWGVDRVKLDREAGVIHVWIREDEGAVFPCPECAKPCPLYDHTDREWRHLDTCQFETRLHARLPRVECPAHGVKTVRVPWAEPKSGFTLLFESLAISWLREMTPAAVSRHMRISWDEARGIMERAVRRGLSRREEKAVRRIGIDEKSFQRRHDYVTVVTDLDERTVIDVLDDRKKETLSKWFLGLSQARLDGIEVIAMDMWDPYIQAVHESVPDAPKKIVFDKFHIVRHLCDAVDRVRRGENKALMGEGRDWLKGTRYDWLKTPANFTHEAWERFKDLRESNLKTARAWAIKETAMGLWNYTYERAARTFFKRWYWWATHSRLGPMIEKARMLRDHLTNILTYLKHRVTNAVTEGLNAKIQWIRYCSRGFRNRENFKMAILFHCGGLNMEPCT